MARIETSLDRLCRRLSIPVKRSGHLDPEHVRHVLTLCTMKIERLEIENADFRFYLDEMTEENVQLSTFIAAAFG